MEEVLTIRLSKGTRRRLYTDEEVFAIVGIGVEAVAQAARGGGPLTGAERANVEALARRELADAFAP